MRSDLFSNKVLVSLFLKIVQSFDYVSSA